jgi:hypothetical protein
MGDDTVLIAGIIAGAICGAICCVCLIFTGARLLVRPLAFSFYR